jgi:hypothetical protein
MQTIILDTDAQTVELFGGRHHAITILGGGTATLKIRFAGGSATYSDFTDNVMTDGAKIIVFPSCTVELTKTGAAVVELKRTDG